MAQSSLITMFCLKKCQSIRHSRSGARVWNLSDGDAERCNKLLAVRVEPLPALAVGEEAVPRGTLGRALERGLCGRDLNRHWWCGQQAWSRRMHGWGVHRPQSACISKPRLLVGVFQLLLQRYSCSRYVSWLGGEVTVNGVTSLLVRQVLHGLKCRCTWREREAH